MDVPCVRVAREDGERTRQALADTGLIAREYDIVVEDGWLYVPVADPASVPDEYEVVAREVPERETQTTPADLLDEDPGYERLGEIALLHEDDAGRAEEIAAAIVESDLPVRTVLNRESKVKGQHRVRDWAVLAHAGTVGRDETPAPGEAGTTETVHREYGCEYALDLAAVYFSPRLATDRHRVAERVAAGERAVDMFAGVGPFAVPFAKRGAEVVGIDVNERAIEYLRENARRNGVEDRVTAIAGDVRAVGGEYEDWADRIVMNLPHSADEFLETAVTLAGDEAVLHFYDIQHEDDPFGPGERAIREAAGDEYEVSVENRTRVRSYAPHELNVRLDVRLSRRD